MMAPKCWSHVVLVVAMCLLPCVSGRIKSLSPHMDTPFTIHDMTRDTPGPSLGRSYTSRVNGDEDIHVGMDMKVTPLQYARLYLGIRDRDAGHSMAATPWTNAVIPYVVENEDFSQVQRDRISGAMRNWENLTCIQFKPSTPHDSNFINIHHGSGCWSNLGMKGGQQTVNLDTGGCFWKGTVEHELGHTIGLIHEHQRPQRDGYMRVNYYAVGRSSIDSVTKYAEGSDDKLGLPYDYDSIMHYPKVAFSKDWASQTIYTRDPDQEDVIGMTLFPSFIDTKLVSMMYKCNAHCQSPPTCQGDCYVDKNCKCFCPQDMPKEVCVDRHQNCSQWAEVAECDRNPGFMHDKCRKSCGICNDNGAVPKLPCVNGHSQCEQWAKSGECVANSGYMRRSCRPACGLCNAQGGANTGGPCRDKDATCSARAAKGDCVRHADVMLKDCKKSCTFCPGETNDPTKPKPGGCEDPDSACLYWADNGLCYKFYTTMSQKCPKACGTCNKTIVLPDGCVDTNPSCGAWAMSGECDVNPGYMLEGCKLSCNNCPGLQIPDVCVDYDMECPDWKERGECTNNPIWMSKNCRKSCHICGGGEPITAGPCHDERAECPQWAQVGECQRNSYWMLKHCKVSCNTCEGQTTSATTPNTGQTTPTGECVDEDASCQAWAQNGQCDANPGYMRKHCRKSCQVCSGNGDTTTNTQTPTGDCVDEQVNCHDWAEGGQCDANPGYMLNHCKKSCHHCDGSGTTRTTLVPITTPGSCRNDNPNCGAWASAGYCGTRPDYMLKHCKLSCNDCSGSSANQTTTTSTTTETCDNQNRDCEEWKRRNLHVCDNASVQRICKKMCNLCSTSNGNCIDHNKYCADWAADNQCNENPDYMHQNCKKSCKICH